MKSYISLRFILYLSVFGLFVQSCNRSEKVDKATIAVAIEPQQYILEQLVGDRYDVVSLIPSGANPEMFDPTFADMEKVTNAAAFMAVGHLPMEQKIIAALLNKKVKIVDTSNGIELIYGTHSHGDHSHTVVDPHVWASVKNVKIIARNMVDALIEIDTEHSAEYQANYQKFIAELDALDDAIGKELSDAKGNSFVMWHPSLSYFARDYSLRQLAIGHDNKELSVSQFKSGVDKSNEGNVRVFFTQAEFDSEKTAQLAAQVGADTVMVNLMGKNFISELKKCADAIYQSYE